MQFTYVFYFFEFFFKFLQENLLNKIVLKQNKSNLAIRLCLPDDVMTTVMTSVTGSHYNMCFPIRFGTCTSRCSCHLKSLTSWKLFCYSQLFFCSWLLKWIGRRRARRGIALPVHGNSQWCYGVSRHLYLWISFWHKRIVWQNVLHNRFLIFGSFNGEW